MPNSLEAIPTHPIEWYAERADELAQRVVNAWGPYAQAGKQNELSPKFMTLFEKAYRYRDAKRTADNRRKFNMLSAEEEAEEIESRIDLARYYKSMDDGAEGAE